MWSILLGGHFQWITLCLLFIVVFFINYASHTLLHKTDLNFCLVYQRSYKVSFNGKGSGFICLTCHSQFITLYFDSLTLCIIYTPAQLLFTNLSEIQQKFFQWKRVWFYLLKWPHSMYLIMAFVYF